MDHGFFERPILNSPYEYPGRHWELDAERSAEQTLPRAPGEREQRRQPRADAAGSQAGHRSGQDDGHGDADRLADGERGAAAPEQALYAGLPRRHARDHDQGPPPGAPAERPGQLLREP